MTIHFYNTMTGEKEPFTPFHAGKVGVYVCGVTVWDASHLGHCRAAVIFDTLVRFLQHRGYVVTYVRNYTDVDDKIIQRAHQEKVTWQEIAERYIAEYATEMRALGNRAPDLEPKASAHIPQMIDAIQRLIDHGMAYAADGNVFFAVRDFPSYGKLSGKKIEELEAGVRIDPHGAKRDPLDFALWKASKPGEPTWASPWGPGRPGWHIECSVMSTHYLGQPYDIHGGGRDLIFPHHENEIAQAEGAFGQPFVRLWMHNGMLTIGDEKMSKSLGNTFRTSEVLKQYDVEAIRYFLLSNHYRSPLDLSTQTITDCQTALDRLYATTTRLGIDADTISRGSRPEKIPGPYQAMVQVVEQLSVKVEEALADDLNTPRAFAAVFEGVREINRALDVETIAPSLLHWVRATWHQQRQMLHTLLGLFGSDPAAFRERIAQLAVATRGLDPAVVERLVAERNVARRSKDFSRSDALRRQLTELGVELQDKPDGTTEWKIK